jgi:vanillate O-demethylase ferredoxin subunit
MRFKNVWAQAKVVKTTDVAANVSLLELEPETGAQPYSAGAHIDVTVLINGLPEIRSYSLVGMYAQMEGRYRIGVKRLPASRGGSTYMWSLAPGARLTISQPKNQFQVTFGRPYYTLLAGGIGITPIYGMALELAQKGASFRLLYAGSSRCEMPFLDELTACLGQRLSVFASDEGQRVNVTKVVDNIEAGTQLYVCGPLSMLDAARHAWQARGLPVGDLRYESFAASGQFAATEFQVSVPRLGKKVKVGANQTMLDALTLAGIDVMSDCQIGECGLCVVDVLSHTGVVDHRDVFFSDEQKAENKKMCACVSRIASGDVVIDTAYRGSPLTAIPPS